MLELFKKKTRAVLGIDISSSSIKLLELSKSGDKFQVERYASRPLPEGAVVEKNIARLEAVGEEMEKLASLAKPQTQRAAVAVSGSAVITKIIELNASLSDAEMENQITVEADQYIPYPLEEVAIDFERQRPSRKNEGMVEVLLAACKKENVDNRVEALEMGGFEAVYVDIEAYAMERAFKLLCEQMGLDDKGIVAIMDIGATMTTIYILKDGVSIYTREQVFGGSPTTGSHRPKRKRPSSTTNCPRVTPRKCWSPSARKWQSNSVARCSSSFRPASTTTSTSSCWPAAPPPPQAWPKRCKRPCRPRPSWPIPLRACRSAAR